MRPLLSDQMAQARKNVSQSFQQRAVLFIPTRSRYEFSGVATAEKLLIGGAKELVSPTGFEGICQDVPQFWAVPFHGMVAAA